MIKGKNLIIIIMLVIAPFLAMQVSAHTPEDMQLEYDFGEQNLNVTITHNTGDPNTHYIEQVDIKKNDVLYLSEQYSSQPTTSTFTYNYTVETEDGDVLKVTAICSISGSITRTLTVVGENQTPGAPVIDGPVIGEPGTEYDFTFNTIDPDGDDVKYIVDWGDGNSDTSGFNPSGTDVVLNHTWNSGGIYTITAKAQDVNGLEGLENTHEIDLGNQAPEALEISGKTNGDTGKEYYYTFNAVDPDGDDVKYIVDWGDGNSDTTGLNPSGTDVVLSHTWNSGGTFTIKANAQDINGLDGPENTLKVTMPRNRIIYSSLWFRFIDMFPILQRLLQFIK